MYLCLCKAITEEMFQKALLKSKGHPQEAMRLLGLGSDCGVCLLDKSNQGLESAKIASKDDKKSCHNKFTK